MLRARAALWQEFRRLYDVVVAFARHAALAIHERANGPIQPMTKDLAAVNQVLDRFVPIMESALRVGAWIAESGHSASAITSRALSHSLAWRANMQALPDIS
jgi:hypothetical protein